MKINKSTRISQLIKEDPDAIEVIASINKNFRKLKNPVLRKLLAPRVSIADAANIGGTTVDVFFDKLKNLGFEIDNSIIQDGENHSSGKETKMENINKESLIELDVRPTIEAGNDPFKTILDAANKLPVDGVLLIINSFEPVPLIKILKEKGFETNTEKPEAGVVHTYFRKTEKSGKADLTQVEKTKLSEFELTVTKYGENIKTIDVRHMEMPEPMVTILQEIEKLPEGFALFVHHKRVPQFLLPELEKRDFDILNHEEDENNVKLFIFKKKKEK